MTINAGAVLSAVDGVKCSCFSIQNLLGLLISFPTFIMIVPSQCTGDVIHCTEYT